jgi:hypothetical protein
LIPPGSIGEKVHPVQMRFGAELEWEGQPATVLMFYYRVDLHVQAPKVVHLV